MSALIENGHLLADIREVLLSARKTAYKAVNFAMVSAYWNVGRLIVEDEQYGNRRAEYGKAVLSELSDKLTAEFGKGFTLTNQKYASILSDISKKSHTPWRIDMVALSPTNQGERQQCTRVVYE